MITTNRITIAFVVLFTAVLSAQPARKKPLYCDGYPQYPIAGCLDAPTIYDSLRGSEPIALQGWVLSFATEQQPSDVEVGQVTQDADGEHVRWLSRNDYEVQWRLPRPDVKRAYGLRSEAWGYLIVLKAGVLDEGDTTVVLHFYDPALGHNHQQMRTWLILPE